MTSHVSVAIIGAGAAGIGFGAALKAYGFQDFIILERNEVATSFENWNPETHFISPSFTTNGFGFPDLNAVTPDSSPAHSQGQEHLSGKAYAHYLHQVAEKYQLPVQTQTEVSLIRPLANYTYELTLTNGANLDADYVFIAIGDFSYPSIPNVPGAAYGIHYAQIKHYDNFISDTPQVIIGGNEAAFDVAIHLAKKNVASLLAASKSAASSENPDPSHRLSTYTASGYQKYHNLIHLRENKTLLAINKLDHTYRLMFRDGTLTKTDKPPIFATGFSCTQSPLVSELFINYNDRPLLNKHDESTLSPNIFLLGPQVQHRNVLLCYIYKYRQRFAPLAETVLTRIGIDVNPEISRKYQLNGMYLTNFENCQVDC